MAEPSEWIALVGVVLSLIFGIIALRLSYIANRLSKESSSTAKKANEIAQSSAETADEAYRYSTGLAWQLIGYEDKEETETPKFPILQGGQVTFFLRALGDSPATDVRINFSYDPNEIRTKPTRWPLFIPGETKPLAIESGLTRGEFDKISYDEDVKATVTWTDILGKQRDYQIPLDDIPFWEAALKDLLDEY